MKDSASASRPEPCEEELARRVLGGDRAALEQLVGRLQGDVFGLALRMLGHREDAEDAAQEILIRIMTRLSRFDFRSRLRTWAYRIAVNAILDFRKTPWERRKRSFDELGEAILAGLSAEAPAETERSALIEEVKSACTLGMLQCLDREHRIAYVLGEIMEVPGPEAASILGIAPALFRKRLQKARAGMLAFLRSHCGLVSDAAPCQCNRQIPAAVRAGLVRIGGSQPPAPPASFEEIRARVREVEEARRALALYRAAGPAGVSPDFARRLIATLDLRLHQAGHG